MKLVYIGWALWAIGVFWAQGAARSIREMVRTGEPPTMMTINWIMLSCFALLCIPVLGFSPFHAIWAVPVAFVVGSLSMVPPLSLLNYPGRAFTAVCCLGLDQSEVQRNERIHREFRELYGSNVAAGMPPEEAQRQAEAVIVQRFKR